MRMSCQVHPAAYLKQNLIMNRKKHSGFQLSFLELIINLYHGNFNQISRRALNRRIDRCALRKLPIIFIGAVNIR